MKKYIYSIFIIFTMSCNPEVRSSCTDTDFVCHFISDFDKVVNYSHHDDFNETHKAYLNLEVLTKGVENIDSLSVLFHDSNIINEKKDELTAFWLDWLSQNRCYDVSKAREKFKRIKLNHPDLDYSSEKTMSKLREKFFLIDSDSDLSESEKDSIIFSKSKQFYFYSVPGWK